MSRAKGKSMTEGATVQTNDAFRRKFPRFTQWRGTLLRAHPSIEGAWYVEMAEPAGLPPQVINSKFLEVTS